MNRIAKHALAIVGAALLMIGGYALPAAAAPSLDPDTEMYGLTGDEWEQAFAGLEASDVYRENSTVDGVDQITYTFDGFSLSVPDKFKAADLEAEHKSAPDMPRPRLGGGVDSNGNVFVSMNQWDQDAVINGTGLLLAAGICAAAALSPAACLGVGAVVAAAAQWLSYNGKCPANQQLILPLTGVVCCIPPPQWAASVRCG